MVHIILKSEQDNTNIGKVADFIISRRQNLQVKTYPRQKFDVPELKF